MAARAALGLVQLREIDLSRLELIRRASMTELRDQGFVENELLPALGLSGDAAELYPKQLRPYTGSGLHHWQYPSQFSKYLVLLSEQSIGSYLEIGVQHGGTFAITVEYLQRFHPLRAAYAVDVNRVPSLKTYAARNPAVHVLREDSSSTRFVELVRSRGPFDLVFIDGDHSEAACRRDFEAVVDHASLIAFHDIVDVGWPGVASVWNAVKREYGSRFRFEEFTDQYEEVQAQLHRPSLGIGLAMRRNDTGQQR
jgi:cephalosporin hydroxylase